MKTRHLLFFVALFTATLTMDAQDASAAFQIDATDKGFLMPRLTTAQRTAISSPTSGLQVYDTDTSQIMVYNGSAWVAAAAGKFVDGATATDAVFTGGNVGIGSTMPFSALHVDVTDPTITAYTSSSGSIVYVGGILHSANYTDVAQNIRGNFIDVEYNPTSTPGSSQSQTAFNSGIVTTSGNSVDLSNVSLNGGGTEAQHLGNGNLNVITGGAAGARNSGTGTVNLIQGHRSNVFNNGAGTTTNMSGYIVGGNINRNAGATIDTFKGFELGSIANSGTINNTYGLYIGDITAGTQTNTPYSIYAGDANAYSYFAGNVGIGFDSPSSKLAIDGDTYVNGKLGVGVTASTTTAIIRDSGSVSTMKFSTPGFGFTFGLDGNSFKFGNSDDLQSNVTMTIHRLQQRVGINTISPSADLDVNGIIKISENASITPQAGMMRFNSATSKFQGYDGSAWVDLH